LIQNAYDPHEGNSGASPSFDHLVIGAWNLFVIWCFSPMDLSLLLPFYFCLLPFLPVYRVPYANYFFSLSVIIPGKGID
jgi:hypothetical protein